MVSDAKNMRVVMFLVNKSIKMGVILLLVTRKIRAPRWKNVYIPIICALVPMMRASEMQVNCKQLGPWEQNIPALSSSFNWDGPTA